MDSGSKTSKTDSRLETGVSEIGSKRKEIDCGLVTEVKKLQLGSMVAGFQIKRNANVGIGKEFDEEDLDDSEAEGEEIPERNPEHLKEGLEHSSTRNVERSTKEENEWTSVSRK